MADGLWLAGLIVLAVVGVTATVLRLPGTWLIVAAAAVHSWHYSWQRPHWHALIGLAVLAGVAEAIELFASVTAARRAGASRRASWCALVGGMAGMFVFTFPMPIIGTILGGALGCFLGALVGEWTVRSGLAHGTKVGLFAAVGTVVGTVAKSMIALLIAATAVLYAI